MARPSGAPTTTIFRSQRIDDACQMNASLRANKEKLSEGCRKAMQAHSG